MPFIRHSRDKRGYERTVVMHAYRSEGKQQNRVLYFFRTPANLKIGRKALEPEVVEALEHTHPDLSFDWTNVRFDIARPDSRERSGREGRRGGQGRGSSSRRGPVDASPLAGVLGTEEASRLRKAYADLLQRISRRAKTPEDRDRLTERAERLNPEGWSDERAIREGAKAFEAENAAIQSELPARRRGRRGGRRRDGASGIMAEGRENDEKSTSPENAGDAGGPPEPDAAPEPDRAADAGGDDGRVRPEPDTGPADDVPGDG